MTRSLATLLPRRLALALGSAVLLAAGCGDDTIQLKPGQAESDKVRAKIRTDDQRIDAAETANTPTRASLKKP